MKARFDRVLLPAAMGLFVVLGLVGILHHEMWRDELEIWLIARDSDSLRHLFHNMRTEGHPALWYLLVFAVSRLSSDPLSMQLLHLAIASTSVALILRHAPFPVWTRILLCFSYFVFYEYTIISRSYGLEFLLAFAFCTLYPRREERLPWLALLLFAMANTNLYGALLAASLGCCIAVEAWIARPRIQYRRPAEVALSLGLAAVGIAMGLGQIYWQSRQIGPAHAYHPEPSLEWFVLSLPAIEAAYLPLPNFRSAAFWNTNVFDALPPTWTLGTQSVLAVMLLVLSVWLLASRRSVLVLFLLGFLSMFCVTLFVWFGQLRHHGHIFLLFVIACWLQHYARDGEDRRRVLRERSLTALLALQVVAGGWAFVLDLRHPFSNAAALGRLLQQEPWAEHVLVGSRDYAVQPIAAYVSRPIFYPESGKFGTFIDWGPGRRKTRAVEALHAAVTLARKDGKPVLLILNLPPSQHAEMWRQLHRESDVYMRGVASFDGAIVPEEDYVVIEVFPTSTP